MMSELSYLVLGVSALLLTNYATATISSNFVKNNTCHGDSVVFTCTTENTLNWFDGLGTTAYISYTTTSIPGIQQRFLQYTMVLTSINGTTLTSTATLDRLEEDTTIRCSSGSGINADSASVTADPNANEVSTTYNVSHFQWNNLTCCDSYRLAISGRQDPVNVIGTTYRFKLDVNVTYSVQLTCVTTNGQVMGVSQNFTDVILNYNFEQDFDNCEDQRLRFSLDSSLSYRCFGNIPGESGSGNGFCEYSVDTMRNNFIVQVCGESTFGNNCVNNSLSDQLAACRNFDGANNMAQLNLVLFIVFLLVSVVAAVLAVVFCGLFIRERIKNKDPK